MGSEMCIRDRSPVVVVDDVSPVVRTGDVDGVKYRAAGVGGVLKTQQSVLFVCCVGNVDGEAEEFASVLIAGIYIVILGKNTCIYDTQFFQTRLIMEIKIVDILEK